MLSLPRQFDSPIAVVFDVDGVLIDSYHAHWRSWQQLARETGAEFSQRQFASTFGQRSSEVLRRFWPSASLTDELVRHLDERKEAIFRELIAAEPVMPGAVSLIDSLAAAGFRLAVGSSAPPENVDLVLAKLQRTQAFSARMTAADVTRGKPDPQVYLLAAQRLGIAPACCAVVEDAPQGIEAAHAAGMVCIGLASTGRTHGELSQADLIVDRLDDLSPARIVELMAKNRR